MIMEGDTRGVLPITLYVVHILSVLQLVYSTLAHLIILFYPLIPPIAASVVAVVSLDKYEPRLRAYHRKLFIQSLLL